MECLHRSPGTGSIRTRIPHYDNEKLTRLREKIAIVFECECVLDDATLSERYDLTSDGDLVMILK